MTSGSIKAAASTLALVVAAGLAQSAHAQSQPVPPEHFSLDARGVDLVTGAFNYATTEVVIGQPGAGGLAHTRQFVGGQAGWRDVEVGGVTVAGPDMIVSTTMVSTVFEYNGVSWEPKYPDGSELVASPFDATFVDRDGDTANFVISPGTSNYDYDYLVVSEESPDGLVVEYHWKTLCPNNFTVTPPCVNDAPVTRLQSITNNRGYQLKFEYVTNDRTDPDWLRAERVVGLNNAVDECDPDADTCTYSRTWPSVTYSGGTLWPTTATDQSGRATTYSYTAMDYDLDTIRYPGSVADDVDVDYSAPRIVSDVTDATGAWTYAYSTVGSTQTTTASGPLSQAVVAETDLTIGRVVSVTDAASNEWEYAYDADLRLERITLPEDNYVEYAYDGRGNLTTVTQVAKPGTPIADIVTETTYPASCTSPYTAANCNKPLSVEDPLGNVTTFEWDDTHGGLLSVTYPAVGGVNAQTRYDYAAFDAYYKYGGSSIVAGPSAVTLPIEVSACATADDGTGCDGTADEVLTTFTYGSTGVANNLLPTAVASGAGDASLTATVNTTWTENGDLKTRYGPVTTNSERTEFRYDNARQLVGIVGPDPDGGGTLLNRARRMTYDGRGLVTLVETGTTPGYTDGDWTSFAPLQRATTAYDGFGRPIETRVQSVSGPTTYAVSQTSYDAAGRVECVVLRMNPAEFGSLPSSACTLDTTGYFGADRIARFAYNSLGQLTSTTAGYATGDATTTGLTYTDNGLPESLTDANGNVSINVYDRFDRVESLRYPDAVCCSTSVTDYEAWTYDAASNVLTYRNRGGNTFAMVYDARNRLKEVDLPYGTDYLDYAYDNLSRSTTIATPAQSLTYLWDALSRLSSEAGPRGTMAYGYDLAGSRTQITWPDTVGVTYSYDLYGAMKTVDESGPTTLAAFYYDDLGRRTHVSRLNGADTDYAYDPIGRLATLSHDLDGSSDDVNFTYAYNPAGQIISRAASNGGYVYAPATGATGYSNDGKNQLTAVNASAVTTNAQGDITGLPGAPAYGYDAAGRLISAGSADYAFDPAGRLYETDGATDLRFQYAGLQLATEYNFSNVAMARHVPGAGLNEVIVSYSGGGLTTRTFPIADERLSVIALTDGSGAATVINGFDEYGVRDAGTAGVFQYTGQVWLPDAELYHARARVYAAEIGRFTAPDSIGYAGGPNLYGYVSGDPLNLIDLLGMDQSECPSDGTPDGHTCNTGGHVRCTRTGICRRDDIYDFLNGYNWRDSWRAHLSLTMGGEDVGERSTVQWQPPLCEGQSQTQRWSDWIGDRGDEVAVGGTLTGTAPAVALGGGVSLIAEVVSLGDAALQGDWEDVRDRGIVAVAGRIPGGGLMARKFGWDPGRNARGQFTRNWRNRQRAQDRGIQVAQGRAADVAMCVRP